MSLLHLVNRRESPELLEALKVLAHIIALAEYWGMSPSAVTTELLELHDSLKWQGIDVTTHAGLDQAHKLLAYYEHQQVRETEMIANAWYEVSRR